MFYLGKIVGLKLIETRSILKVLFSIGNSDWVIETSEKYVREKLFNMNFISDVTFYFTIEYYDTSYNPLYIL